MKIIIIVLLLMVVASLFMALFTLVKDKGTTDRTVKFLGLRVALAIGVIAFILISYKAGLIKPNASPFLVDKMVEQQKAKSKESD